jgi:hypothetical protein
MTLRIAVLAACGAAATLALAAAPARTDDRYVLTQALCIDLGPDGQPLPRATCRMQEVPVNAIVEVQVPGTPSQWSVTETPATLTGLDAPVRLPSPGRVSGTAEVWVFTFRAQRAGSGFITLREDPKLLTPAGTFRFPITVRP